MPQLRAPQSQRDKEAAALNCVWLADCPNSKLKYFICHTVCNYEWETTPKSIKHGHGCPKCAGQVLDLDKRRAWAEAINCTWLEDPIYMARKTLIKCNKCDFKWRPCPKDVKDKHGCKKCNPGKFDYNAPARVYLVKDGVAYKVGITTLVAKVDRLAKLARHGWEPVQIWDVPSGKIASDIEKSVLKWFREELELDPAYKEGLGASETIKTSNITAEEIIKKIEELACILI